MEMNETDIEQLQTAVQLRAQGKSLEKEGKALQETANSTIHPLLLAFGLEKTGFDVPGVGKVTLKNTHGGVIVETTLREKLLLAGLPPEKINETITASTTTWQSTFVDFRAAKSKG